MDTHLTTSHLSAADAPSDVRVTVVICTYNRCGTLATTLESATALYVPAGLRWELLVVDNNSTDRTRDVVLGFATRLPVRYLFEPRQGKTHALNRAVAEARGELLLFTDDDVRLAPDWLEGFVHAARANPTAGWFGGRVFPWWLSGRPDWLKDECLPALSGYFGQYDLGDAERLYTTEDGPPYGANMAVRRQTFEQIGGYREDLGPCGDRWAAGEDTELTLRAQALGIPGVYVPWARCRHAVPGERLPMWNFLRYGVRKGEGLARLDGPAGPRGSLLVALSQAARAVPQAFRGRWDRVRICCMNIGIELGRRKARYQESGVRSQE